MQNQKNVRTFISVDLPEELKISISKKIRDLSIIKKSLFDRNCKLVAPLNYHLTIAFLGNTTKEELSLLSEDFRNNLKKRKLIECKTNGLGVFPNPRFARILFLNIESKELKELAQQIREILHSYGFKLDHEFKSHITVARFRKKISIINLEELSTDLLNAEFNVDSFYLMQSILTPAGPLYSKLDKFDIN